MDGERAFLPLPRSSLSSSIFTLPSRAAGTDPARLLLDLATSLSFWLLMTTLGLGPPGLSAAILSRSSTLSVNFRFPWRSRPVFPWPTLAAREADETSGDARRAARIPIWVEMSLPPSTAWRRACACSRLRMLSRSACSSSLSIREEGSSPRPVYVSVSY